MITRTGTTAHPGRSGGRPAALYRFTESQIPGHRRIRCPAAARPEPRWILRASLRYRITQWTGMLHGAVSPEWIGRAPARGARSAGTPACPARSMDPFYDPAGGFQHADPRHRAALTRRRTRLPRVDSPEGRGPPSCCTARPTATACPEATVTTVLVPAGHARINVATCCRTSAPSTRCPHAASRPTRCAAGQGRRVMAQLEYLLMAAGAG